MELVDDDVIESLTLERAVELLAERVNRVPEKNLLAFLDLVGVERGAGVPAEAPVTFLLSNRSEEGALVPAGTQVATTQTESANAQVFETRDQFFATPARLVSAIDELAAAVGDDESGCTQVTERLARAWAMITAADPELASRAARY